MEEENWFRLKDITSVISPSLLVYRERVVHNIEEMIRMVGDTKKLCPHIKTHKCAEIVQMQMKRGINKFKCANIAEAELLGNCGAPQVLLAMQPVGANIARFITLMKTFPNTEFSALTDTLAIADKLATSGKENDLKISLYIDLNVGMNRTGIAPDEKAFHLYKHISENPHLNILGLHVYDGHLRNPDFDSRKQDCDKAFDSVLELKERILEAKLPNPIIIAGGSPTFPIHSKRENVIASPGTTLLWDAGYGGLFPEMKFLPAAVLFTRIISKPKPGILCFDLGHKSIAPEMPFPRVEFLSLKHDKQISQSEEHLVVEYDDLNVMEVGTEHYAIPKHICPTVAKYDELLVVDSGKITDAWKVAARNHKISI
ncbi:D-TA family PLP-dependent enzyme [Maribacter algicola]|uniref:D-TA family PLP-dependent enzyme n=1 Tax=Maribacter algicola TaxID=2498892 RepID=A0A3R8Q0C2_9FLAO|nr:D-TA family PLP-dependent enzyme [Maribacter algicola]RRQ50412.1 D-TA family PLP-dependent enzyme [Maribacter algicola]